MKKRLETVIIPQAKEGWNKGELIKITLGQIDFALYDSETGIDNWEAQQVLLIDEEGRTVASHPILDGSLAISSETLKVIADKQGDCAFEAIYDLVINNTIYDWIVGNRRRTWKYRKDNECISVILTK